MLKKALLGDPSLRLSAANVGHGRVRRHRTPAHSTSAIALAVVSGSLIALAPIRSLLGGDLSSSTFADRSSGGGGAGVGRPQRALVFTEVLLAVVMVTGAARSERRRLRASTRAGHAGLREVV